MRRQNHAASKLEGPVERVIHPDIYRAIYRIMDPSVDHQVDHDTDQSTDKSRSLPIDECTLDEYDRYPR